MQLTAALQLSRPAMARNVQLSRPVRAFSASSAYLGSRIESSKMLGMPQLAARRCRAAWAQPVQASFFGVGAPEAILVGVVALVVFGPKGLAQAARGLGDTLRSFAPTIRELTSVSQELKSTLEQEIGINEIKEELSRPAVPTPRPVSSDAASSSDSEQPKQQGAALSELADSMAARGQGLDDSAAKLVDPDIESKRAAAAAAAWGGASPAAAAPAAPAAAAAVEAAPAAAAAARPRAMEAMSLEELEAELAKRKAAVAQGQLPKQLSADDA